MSGYKATFFIYVLLFIFLFRFLAGRWPSLRPHFLLAINVCFLAMLGSALSMRDITFYVVAIGLFGWIVSASKAKWALFCGIILALVSMFVIKYPFYTSALVGQTKFLESMHGLAFIGLSYATLRAIDYMILMSRSRAGDRPSFLMSACYLTFFPAYVSGPINRFSDFVSDLQKPLQPLTWPLVRGVILRSSIGVIKVLVLSKIAYSYSPFSSNFDASSLTFAKFMLGFYASFFYIYLDFSGYCDIAISIASLFGIVLPENFNIPFMARNIQDFWNRWHISLSHWCRDFIFFPLFGLLSARLEWLPRLASYLFAMFVTFFLIGSWHGDSLHWTLYGVYHGVGVSLCVAYGHLMQKFWPGLLNEIRQRWWYQCASVAITFNFVSFGFVLALPPLTSLSIFHWLLA